MTDSQGPSMMPFVLTVATPVDPLLLVSIDDADDFSSVLSDQDRYHDQLDNFNCPRIRRWRILQELRRRQQQHEERIDQEHGESAIQILFAVLASSCTPIALNQIEATHERTLSPPRLGPSAVIALLHEVHSPGMIEFLQHAWDRWNQLGREGRQDPLAMMITSGIPVVVSSEGSPTHATFATSPPLVPGNTTLLRDFYQRPSRNVMGQMGFYCTDTCTPIFAQCWEEVCRDIQLMHLAVQCAIDAWQSSPSPPSSPRSSVVYALPTHPGHHAARDSFGGYCYVNHAAVAVKQFQAHLSSTDGGASVPNVAVLDVDYHAGNGTASIFYTDPTVLVISLHCDPDFDYPFHSGFTDDTGAEQGIGTTLNIPLPPRTTWEPTYRDALARALDRLREFDPHAVVVSVGLDTYREDPCTLRRAGFQLEGDDYRAMGQAMGRTFGALGIPVLAVQEGGYRMDTIAVAAANVVTGICHGIVSQTIVGESENII